MAATSPARLALALELELVDDNGEASARVPETEAEAEAGGGARAWGPRRDFPQEVPLRAAVKAIQHEAAKDKDAFEMLHEVCQETLQSRERMARLSTGGVSRWGDSGSEASERGDAQPVISAPLSAPKSPQERLMALMPAAIDKGRGKYARRTSPAGGCAETTPRWQRIDGDTAAITDIAVIFAGDPVPEGLSKLERSPNGTRADLNKGARGVFVYLCIGKDGVNKTPISEIIAIFPDRGEFVPPDYEIVLRRGVPANLNTGTQGEKIFLCVRRSSSTSIVDVMVLFPKKGDRLPYGYTRVDQTPNGYIADLNSSSGGAEVFIAYKKKLNCIHDLYKRWLATTVVGQSDPVQSPKPPPNTPSKELPSSPLNSIVAVSPSSTIQKCIETRENEPTEQLTDAPTISDNPKDWSSALEYYMYPILLACYTRHSKVAEIALQGIGQCLDAGLFDGVKIESDCCHIGTIIDAVTAACQQAVKSRFSLALTIFRKVIRKNSGGFNPSILHSTLKALTFIGDFDSTMVKSVEDELIYKIMNRYEAENAVHASSKTSHDEYVPRSAEALARDFILTLIDDVSTGVEIASKTESVLGTSKSHPSIQSPSFCAEIDVGLSKLATTAHERNALQLVITLSKVVHRKASSAVDTNWDNDRWSGHHSLRALNVVLLAAGASSREKRVFGQVVRRFVLATVNSASLIGNKDAFRGNLALISTLWNHYRRHLKVELALVFEHVFLRILKSTAPLATNFQLDIMHELLPWFQLAPNVVELFLNFDLDRVQQWKIFEHLCTTMCSIAEGATAVAPAIPDDDHHSRLQLQIQAITTVLAINRSVMDASGHAHLISRDPRTRLLSMEVGGWEQDDESWADPLIATNETHENATEGHLEDSQSPETPANLNYSVSTEGPALGARYGSMSVRMRNEVQKRNQQLLKRAIEISSTKSLKKAIEYLVAMNFVKDTPRDITSFLRIYHDFFDETELGDYLGEGDEDFKVQVRLTYVRAISFEGMTLVESLRHFLTSGGFRLPGEAQKIERMVEAFAQCFYEDSPSSFSSADTAMIIAYSIIMLNTDLHNPQVKKNKMSKEQFVKNNRGIDNGKDLPRRFLEEIYDDILHNPMHIKGSQVVSTSSREASLSARDVENSKFRGSLIKSVAQSEELMKDLSQSYVTFQFVGIDACISPDLIKLLFERVWFYFLTLSTSILGDNQADMSMTMHCLDLLRFCISTCLFLRMPVERQAFCTLLSKVEASLDGIRSPCEDGISDEEYGADDSGHDDRHFQQEWLRSVENAADKDDPWLAMGDIHVVVNKMKEAIQHRQRSQELNSVLRRINRSSYYLKDTTQFIREGDLVKKCRSRNRSYRFFLFNDQLLYADKGMSGYWNPHNSLRLKLTRVSDIADNVIHKHAFHIQNPVKSFIVFADSAITKAEWMRAIEDAVTEGAKKISRNARRISTKGVGAGADNNSGDRTPTTATAVIGFMRRSSRLGSIAKDPSGSVDSPMSQEVTAALPSESEQETLSPAPLEGSRDDTNTSDAGSVPRAGCDINEQVSIDSPGESEGNASADVDKLAEESSSF